MINAKLETAINDQINSEIYSAYMYYAMAAYFESLSLTGFAHWLRVQALEELTHVQKFSQYLLDRGGKVVMRDVKAPPSSWESPLDAFTQVYEHEVHVTSQVNKLMDLALAESDHACVQFFQWFVGEQVEEEANTDNVVQRLKLVENTKQGIFLLDQELNQRTFVMPPEFAGVF